MKICKYCDSVNEDSASVCKSCGASDFKYKCNNCGTEFEEGDCCPECGLKIGSRPKTCPVCQTEYYSNACPNCGYLSNTPFSSAGSTEHKKNLFLWVCGWLFFFPIPLSVMICRSQKLKKPAKIAFMILLWLSVFFFSLMN